MSKKKITSEELEQSAIKVAQRRRAQSLKNRKEYVMSLPDSPPLLCISELAIKTRLPVNFLRKLIVEENRIPYIKLNSKYYINYNAFVDYINTMK